MQFPTPSKFSGGSTRLALSRLESYEARCAGEPEPAPRDSRNERYLSVKQVAERYGVSVATIWRWCQESRKRGTGA